MYTTYRHPKSGVPILGMRLIPGAVLTEKDVSDSGPGAWEACTIPGTILGNIQEVWIRPRDLTLGEKSLLHDLAITYKGCYIWIARNLDYERRKCIFVPTLHFNWKNQVKTPEVTHPECIRTLLDVGYLVEDPQYHEDGTEFFTLTDDGRAVDCNLSPITAHCSIL